eukprot:7555425-Alexandrium_andersonii.AAC.1
MSDEGLRPGAVSSGGVGNRVVHAAPQDAQSAELSASPGRAPPSASGSGWRGGYSAAPRAAAGASVEAPMRQGGGGESAI